MKRAALALLLILAAIGLYKFGVYCLTPEWYEMGKPR